MGGQGAGNKSTGAQRHRGTGTGLRTRIEDWASRFLFPWGQRDAVRGCGSLRYVLGSSLGIRQALKNRTENMCPSEYVASYDNAYTLPNVSLFLCKRLVDVHSQSRAQKKQQATKCPCSPRSSLRVLLTNVILLQATLLCRRPKVPHGKPRAEHVSPTFPFQAGPSSGEPRATNLLALSSVFPRSTFPRAHLVLRWHTNTCIHMLQVTHSLHMFFGGGT